MASGTDPVYTLRQIARRLRLPESTVRYYRDTFENLVPSVGRGRRRRYPEAAGIALRVIADGFAHGRTREAIRAELARPAGPPAADAPGVALAPTPDHLSNRELLDVMLDGERERRELMWHMAKEMVRLGEAIERQQGVLTEMGRRLADATPVHRLPPPAPLAPPAPSLAIHPPPVDVAQEELEGLRAELDRERDLVERLRQSKLEMERRAAEAEARLDQLERDGRKRGLIGRLLRAEE